MIRRSRRLNRLQDGDSGNASQSTSNGTPVNIVRSNARLLNNGGSIISNRRVVRTSNGSQLGVVISRNISDNNITNSELSNEEVETNSEDYAIRINQLNNEVNRLNQELSAQRELNNNQSIHNQLLTSQQSRGANRSADRSRSRSVLRNHRRPGFKEAIKHRMVFTGDGDADYEDWREQVQLSIFSVYDLSEEEKIMYLTANMEGQARRFIVSGNQGTTFDRVVNFDKLMKEGFEGKVDWHGKFFGCKQQSGEKIRMYVNKLQVLCRKMFPNGNKEEINKLCLTQIKLHALPEHKSILKYINLENPFEDIIKQLTSNEDLEEVSKTKKRNNTEMMNNIESKDLSNENKVVMEPESCSIKKMKEDFNNTAKQIKDNVKSNINNLTDVVNRTQEQINELMSFQRNHVQLNELNNRSRRPIRCFFCGKFGHMVGKCRNAPENDKKRILQQLREKTFNFQEWEKQLAQRQNSLNSRPTLEKSAPPA